MDIKKESISVKLIDSDLIELINLQTGQKANINKLTYDVICSLINEEESEIFGKFEISECELAQVKKMMLDLNLLSNNKNSIILNRELGNSIFDSDMNDYDKRILFVGLPYDSGSTGPTGSKEAPNYIRRYYSGFSSTSNDFYFQSCSFTYSSQFGRYVEDFGNILYIPGEGYNAFHERVINNLSKVENKKILGFGGDHSVSYSILEGLTQRNKDEIIYVKFDAHFDCAGTSEFLPINHHNYVEKIREKENVSIWHIGVREPRLPFYETRDDLFITDFNQLNDMINKNRNKKFYLSIDVDILEPMNNPGTAYQIPEVFEIDELISFLDLFDKINIIGLDVVEFNPLLDRNNSSLKNVKKILTRAIRLLETL